MRRIASALLAVVAVPALSAGRPAGAQEVRAEVIGALVEHRLANGREPEREFGAAFGAAASYEAMSWVELRARLLGGALAAQTENTDDRRFGELDISAVIDPFPWIAFEVGAGSRTFTGPLGRQRWITMRAGAELRVHFVDGRIEGTLGGALVPVVSVSGTDTPSVAAMGSSGLSYSHRNLTARLVYRLERYDFPAQGTVQRLEQVSSLSAQIGVRVPKLF